MSPVEIRTLIEDAWSGTEYPGHDRIAYDTSLEGLQVAQFFRGRKWKTITLAVFETYSGDSSACLCFMLPDGFRYYLPAYMLIAVDEYPDADVTADSAVYALTPPASLTEPLWRERSNLFSADQRTAIVAFLKFMETSRGTDYPVHSPRDALPYWSNAV